MNKITDTELQKIQLLKEDALEIASTLGELSYQKISIELLIKEQEEKIKGVKKEEAKIFDELKNKYGSVNINIETGEIS
jgi:hypothetical protein